MERFEYDDVVILKRRTVLFDFAEAFYKKPFNYGRHEHERAYFTLTDNCVYREVLGGKTFDHPPNTIIWRPKEISHADAIAHSNGRSFSVFIKNSLLTKFSEYTKIPPEISEQNTYLAFLARRLRSEFRNWDDCSPLIAEGLVYEMLGEAARKRVRSGNARPLWLVRVVEKLDDEFTRRQTNLQLAAEAGVHPVHLARTFRRHYGCSIGRYLREKRVQYALELLMAKKSSLAEIAHAAGFADQSQFTRTFKRATGITPGAFRDEFKKRWPKSWQRPGNPRR